MFTALLDTSVLWPSLQRDFLLSLSIEGLYRPLWSEAILDELREHEIEKLVSRHGMSRQRAGDRADHLVIQMTHFFNDSIVRGWEDLDGSFGLPDPDDEHVVSAAVMGSAGVIVTDNLRDFPRALVPRHIDIQNAREFAASTVSVDPEVAVGALVQIAQRHRDPAHSPTELLGKLVDRYRMDDVTEMIAPLL